MNAQGKFYIVHESEVRFDIESLLIGPFPILWDFDGLFCIIPITVLQNAIDRKSEYNKLSNKTSKPGVYIYWDQGIPISNEAGRALLGE